MAENLVFGFYDGKITPYYSSVTIVIQISSPNLVSIRLLSDSRQTLDGLLMDSWQTPDGLLTDSWQTPDRFLTDSQQTHIKPQNRLRNLESCPNQLSNFGELSKSALQIWLPSNSWQTTDRLLKDSWLTPNRLTNLATLCWRWHQVSIWRAVQISSLMLESFQDQLFKFGYHQTPERLLTDSRQTPNRLRTDSH